MSTGCANCYADTLSKRNPLTLGVWGPNGTRVVAAESAWREPLKWDRAAKAAGERHRVFCASLADVFEDWQGAITNAKGGALSVNEQGQVWSYDTDGTVDDDWGVRDYTMADVRTRLFNLILNTPHLDWLLLTKRPQHLNEPDRLMWAGTRWPDLLPNVWLGTSVEDQAAADERIPHLLAVPAAVRFLSCEPLLSDVDLRLQEHIVGAHDLGSDNYREADYLHWVIAGGESGKDARPMHPGWARSLRDQCQAAGVAFHYKQAGEWLGWSQMTDAEKEAVYHPLPAELEHHPDHRGHNPHREPHRLLLSAGDSGVGESLYRVGKAAAGRTLDGREWDDLPAAAGGEA